MEIMPDQELGPFSAEALLHNKIIVDKACQKFYLQSFSANISQ